MSSQIPVPCDESCLIKFFQDNNGAALRLQQVADDAEHIHKCVREGNKAAMPADLAKALPGLIAKQQAIRQLTIDLRDDYRKACGYKGQGLTP